MTKHSKNNTASSVFSYAEYKKLDYGTKKVRLSVSYTRWCPTRLSNGSGTSRCAASTHARSAFSAHAHRWRAPRAISSAPSACTPTSVRTSASSRPSASCSRGAVAQKKDIKRQKQRLDALKREHADEQARAKAAARERVLAEFERGQLGLAGPSLALSTNGKPEEGLPPPCNHLLLGV
jgi:nitric oxide synthase-interacting protein